MSKKITISTGYKAPVSGQYRPEGTRDEVTFVKGHRIPPYQNQGKKFTLVDKTK